MAIPSVLAGQKYLGGWIPADPMTTIIVGKKGVGTEDGSGIPFFAVFSSTGLSASGPSEVPCELDVPVYYDFEAERYVCVKIPIEANIGTVVVATFPNTPENNDKYRDVAYVDPNYVPEPEEPEPEYVPINEEYHMQEWPITLIVGLGGVNAVYELEGAISLRDKQLFVSGMGYSAAKLSGKVTYWMTATVFIDDQAVMTKSLELSGGPELWPDGPDNKFSPIGSARFDLPEPVFGQKTILKLEGAYTYDTEAGGYIVPPEYYAKHEVNIDIRQKLKEEAPIL